MQMVSFFRPFSLFLLLLFEAFISELCDGLTRLVCAAEVLGVGPSRLVHAQQSLARILRQQQ